IQNTGSIGVRPGKDTLTLIFRTSHSAEVQQTLRNIKNLLGLDPNATEFRIVYGLVPSGKNEIALVTRSIYEVLLHIASSIIVPGEHVIENRVVETPEADLGPEGPVPALIRISSSSGPPGDAFVAIPYHGNWFSISDRDHASKNLFSFILIL